MSHQPLSRFALETPILGIGEQDIHTSSEGVIARLWCSEVSQSKLPLSPAAFIKEGMRCRSYASTGLM
jgi:hypothetical protein